MMRSRWIAILAGAAVAGMLTWLAVAIWPGEAWLHGLIFAGWFTAIVVVSGPALLRGLVRKRRSEP
jgi:hypothetical protein